MTRLLLSGGPSRASTKSPTLFDHVVGAAAEPSRGYRAPVIKPTLSRLIPIHHSEPTFVNGQSVVFIPTGDRQFAWRAVHTGLVANGKTQITSGLAVGTPVVGEGSYWLKAALMQSTIPDQG
jgi:hypothetical protein